MVILPITPKIIAVGVQTKWLPGKDNYINGIRTSKVTTRKLSNLFVVRAPLVWAKSSKRI